MRKEAFALALVATVVVGERAARAQDGEGKALDAVARFLVEGDHAPEEGKGLAAVKGSLQKAPSFADTGLSFVRPGDFIASVDTRTNQVVFFSRFKPLLYVEERDLKNGGMRTKDDRAAELAKRIHFTLEQSVERAKAFIAARYPDYAKRKFVLERKERLDRDSLVQDELVFVERPREGVVACWPNEIHASVNPETGAIVTYVAQDDRAESKKKPRLDAKKARKVVLDRIRRVAKPEQMTFFEKEAPVELVAAPYPTGAATAWLVGKVFVVHAETGQLQVWSARSGN